MQKNQPRLKNNAGIAIGPILFVIALLGVLAAAFASSSTSMNSATKADSITPLLETQAQLIRNKFYECNTIRSVWPISDSAGTTLASVECQGDPSGLRNLWSGARNVLLPAPPKDFNAWTYFDQSATGGGRCVMIRPSSTTLAASAAIRQGIAKAYAKFTTQEADYAPTGTNQKLIIWITRPTGSPHSNCVAD
jgi:type II secretory pathway pseudopilin PulG